MVAAPGGRMVAVSCRGPLTGAPTPGAAQSGGLGPRGAGVATTQSARAELFHENVGAEWPLISLILGPFRAACTCAGKCQQVVTLPRWPGAHVRALNGTHHVAVQHWPQPQPQLRATVSCVSVPD